MFIREAQHTQDQAVFQLVTTIVRSLAQYPNAVSVSTTRLPCSLVFNVICSPVDTGRLIGKGGRTARSLRTLLHALGVKHNQRYVIDIRDSSAVAKAA